MSSETAKRCTVAFMLVWAWGFNLLLLAASWHDRVSRAIVWMAILLLTVWVMIFGFVSWRFGQRIGDYVREATRSRIPWQATFVGFCVGLALVEEAITTTLTNLAGALGDPSGKAAITASRNYFVVVATHSVVVFVPMFCAWAWLLTRFDFSPFAVLLLFGVCGLFGEVIAFGPQNLVSAGFWILVYGLMVYVPTLSVPVRIRATRPELLQYMLAIVLPLLCTIPLVIAVLAIKAA